MKITEFLLFLSVLLLVSYRMHNYPQKLVEKNQHSQKEVSRFKVIDLNDDGEKEFLTAESL